MSPIMPAIKPWPQYSKVGRTPEGKLNTINLNMFGMKSFKNKAIHPSAFVNISHFQDLHRHQTGPQTKTPHLMSEIVFKIINLQAKEQELRAFDDIWKKQLLAKTSRKYRKLDYTHAREATLVKNMVFLSYPFIYPSSFFQFSPLISCLVDCPQLLTLNGWQLSIIDQKQNGSDHHSLQQTRGQSLFRSMHHHSTPQELHARLTQLLAEMHEECDERRQWLAEIEVRFGRITVEGEWDLTKKCNDDQQSCVCYFYYTRR